MSSLAASFVAGDKSRLVAGSPYNPGTSDFAWAGYVYRSGTSAYLFSTGGTAAGADGFAVYVASDGKLQVNVNDSVEAAAVSGAVSDAALPLNTWCHAAVNFDRDGVARAWVNGVQQTASLDISGHQASLGYTTNPILGSLADGSLAISGRVLGVRLWNRLLTEDEIGRQANMVSGATLFRPYVQMSSADKVTMAHSWDLQGGPWTASTPAVDAHGSNDLQFAASAIIAPGTNNGGFEGWTEVSGDNLVTNGTFDSDIAGWTNNEATPWQTAEWSSGAVRLVADGSTSTFWQNIGTITAGNVYRVRFDAVKNSGGSITWKIGASGVSGSAILTDPGTFTLNSSGSADFHILCTTTGTAFLMFRQNDGAARDWTIDNVSVVQVASNADTWTESVSGTSRIRRESSIVYAGSYSLAMDVDASNSILAVSQNVLTVNKLYATSFYGKVSDATGSPTGRAQIGGTIVAFTPTVTYALYSLTGRASNVAFALERNANCTGKTLYFDNVTLTAAEILTAAGPPTTTPVLADPSASATSATEADLAVTTDTDAGTLYTVVTASGTPPSAGQIAAGTDYDDALAPFADSQAISSAGQKTFSASGLAAGATYYAHFTHVVAGTFSAVVSSASFDTPISPSVPADAGLGLGLGLDFGP